MGLLKYVKRLATEVRDTLKRRAADHSWMDDPVERAAQERVARERRTYWRASRGR